MTALAGGDISAGEKSRVDRWLDRIEAALDRGRPPVSSFGRMCQYVERSRT